MSKIKIFFAHSFEETSALKDVKMTDIGFACKIRNILKTKIFLKDKFEIITCESQQAICIDEKIKKAIDECHIVIGLFSRKYYDENRTRWIPPPWVISECSYAVGRFSKINNKKIIGIYENGVSKDDLTFLTIGGFEAFEIKDRDHINEAALISYFSPILKSISQDETPPFLTRNLTQIVTIFTNKTTLSYYKRKIRILDNEKFYEEYKGLKRHEFYSELRDLPNLKNMGHTNVNKRFVSPFFRYDIMSINGEKAKKKLTLGEILVDTNKEKKFFFIFPKNLKNEDEIEYHYAWGSPNIFRTEDKKKEYVTLQSDEGKIEETVFQINFERDVAGNKENDLFTPNGAPRYQLSTDNNSVANMSKSKSINTDQLSLWYSIYVLKKVDFFGTIKVSWKFKKQRR